MKRFLLFTAFVTFFFASNIFGQMVNGVDTLYGNEWINNAQTYYKIPVAQDGIHKLTYQELVNAGVPVSSITGNQFQVFHLGQEIPIHTSTSGNFNANEYLEFYGEKNRSKLDEYLYDDPANEMMNPEYSLFTDTSSYYLTWSNGTSNNRMQVVTNNISNPPPADPFFEHEVTVVNNSNWYKQALNSDGVKKSNFQAVEGFGSPVTTSNLVNVNIDHIQSQNNATLFVQGIAAGFGSHNLQMKLNGVEYYNQNLNSYLIFKQSFNIDPADLIEDNKLVVAGLDGASDKNSVAFVKLKYRRFFDFNNESQFTFEVAPSGNDKFLAIDNFDSAGENPILYDITNNIRIETTLSANQVLAKIPGSATTRKLILYNPTNGVNFVNNISNFEPIDFTQNQGEFIIITDSRLMNDGAGNNHVQAYADYRATVAGGGFTTKIVDVNDLYDHFSYGIHRHPLSIRNFNHYVAKKWANPQYIFIIGKGREYHVVRNNIASTFYVPTFGAPGSDNLLGSSNKKSMPVIPIGRISALNANTVGSYLDKVKKRELAQKTPSQTIDDKEWLKKIIHLSGGDPAIQGVIANHLTALENVIEDGCMGADVVSFYKDSADPITISVNQQLFDRINKGISLLTFYGHSSVNTFDFVIDDCDNYNNIDKTFIMMSLGCYAGNIHTGVAGIGEEFTFCEDKGSVAFLASSGLAYVAPLRSFAEKFYGLTGSDNCTDGIGKILQQTIQFHDNNTAGINELTQQFTLHGDPAVTITYTQAPDYVVDQTSVGFEPNVVSALLDNFDINFDVVNIGNSVIDSFSILVERELPDGSISIVTNYKIEAPAYKSSQTLTIPSMGLGSAGLNRFYITVDSEDAIVEEPQPNAESNNELYSSNGQRGIELYVIDDSARPIFPENYAILNNPNITLTSSTLNSTSTPKKYLMEIDTTQYFNSPFKQSTEVTQGGGIVDWTPSVNYQDNTVYYWRISPDSISPQISYNWQGHSFIYLPNESTGWNQSHYFQYLPDEYDRMEMDDNRQFEFLPFPIDITIINTELVGGTGPYFQILGTQNGKYWWWGGTQHMCVTVADESGNWMWSDPNNLPQGAINPFNSLNETFFFKTNTSTEREDLVNFLNGLPPDHTVFFATFQTSPTTSYNPEDWAIDSLTYGTNIFQVLENNGASQVRSLESGSRPYVFIYNTSSGAAGEVIATNNTDIIELDYTLLRNVSDGSVTTVPIGPAAEWQTMEWNPIYSNNPADDEISVSIIGTTVNGTDTLLYDELTALSQDLSGVNSDEIPYIKLKFTSEDAVAKSSAYLDYWRVLYRSLPDAAVNPNKLFACNQDTLQQGQNFELKVAVQNPSAIDLDSLLIKYTFKDQSNNEITSYQREKPLLKGDTLITNLTTPTTNMEGLINFVMEINPNSDQPELYKFNNYAIKQLYVGQDNENPLLDVTFDGYHILDGDIVSPSPVISVSLIDENQFLTLSDTSLFNLFLKYPDGITEDISFMEDFVTFYPAASSAENRAKIELRKTFEMEGVYELIVQAADVTGNQSGALDYKVNFEIVTQTAITNMLNYPNPFSTSTQFVYTLTGDQIPEYFKIQILNVSGRVVKEITQNEMGPLKVGRNKSEYRWDGSDTYGNKLANGVYLYRVIAKNAMGEDFDKIQTDADKFFKKGFGKMVILR